MRQQIFFLLQMENQGSHQKSEFLFADFLWPRLKFPWPYLAFYKKKNCNKNKWWSWHFSDGNLIILFCFRKITISEKMFTFSRNKNVPGQLIFPGFPWLSSQVGALKIRTVLVVMAKWVKDAVWCDPCPGHELRSWVQNPLGAWLVCTSLKTFNCIIN